MIKLPQQRESRKVPLEGPYDIKQFNNQIPLFYLNFPRQLLNRTSGNLDKSLEFLQQGIEEKGLYIDLFWDILKNVQFTIGTTGVEGKEELFYIIQHFKKHLDIIIDTGLKITPSKFMTGDPISYTTYKTIFEALWSFDNSGVYHKGIGNTFTVNSGSLIVETLAGGGELKSITPLVITTVSEEYLEYLFLCWLTGETPNPQIFEVWEDAALNTYMNSSCLARYEESFKKGEVEGIPFARKITWDLKNTFLNFISKPKSVQTISEQISWTKQTVKEALEANFVEEKLESQGIDLIPF